MADRSTTCYVIVQPVWSRSNHYSGMHKGEKMIDSIKVSKLFAKRPPKSSIPAGGVVVELEVEIDDEVFYEQRAKVKVEVQVDQTMPTVQSTPIKRVNPNAKVLQRQKTLP